MIWQMAYIGVKSQAKNRAAAGIQYGGIEMSDKTYEIGVVCGNCGFKGKTSIPKGKLVKQAPCPRCGNKTLRDALPGEVS
jgi:hypothetical protein